MQAGEVHAPVLLQEVLRLFDLRPGLFVVDGTVNGGGHARAMLPHIMPGGTLLGIDWDAALVDRLKKEIGREQGVAIVCGNYAEMPDILRRASRGAPDRILLDLGFSSYHVDASGRGFSFAKDEPLAMTYDENRMPAAAALRQLRERELADMIYALSGEKYSRRIAKSIAMRGRTRPIRTTKELREAIVHAVPPNYEMRRIDPATRTFQALRMHVNDELGNLERFLSELPSLMPKGARAGIVSFHSLEDGMVKRYFRKYEKEKKMKPANKKPIVASKEEIARNPRSRSAKLRVGIF